MASHSHGPRLTWAVGEEECGRGRGMSQVKQRDAARRFPGGVMVPPAAEAFVTIIRPEK